MAMTSRQEKSLVRAKELMVKARSSRQELNTIDGQIERLHVRKQQLNSIILQEDFRLREELRVVKTIDTEEGPSG